MNTFLVARDAPLAPFTRIETAPLIGGGLLVSRVEPMPREGRSHRDWGTSSRALAVVASGADTASAPPPWIVSRPDTRLEIVRGGRGYAVLPLGSTSVPCTQRVEVLAPDGTVCGARDYRIAEGLCDTLDVTLGADGTVIQRLTVSMETHADTTGPHTCTWRWWPGALR